MARRITPVGRVRKKVDKFLDKHGDKSFTAKGIRSTRDSWKPGIVSRESSFRKIAAKKLRAARTITGKKGLRSIDISKGINQ